jgi:large subunit ribosomal protein L18
VKAAGNICGKLITNHSTLTTGKSTERRRRAVPLIGKEKTMITQTKRNAIRQRIHDRIRRKMAGTGERPRLNVYRSLNHIYAQVIDDAKGETVVSASSIKLKTGGNIAAAKEIGKAVAEAAVSKGIKKVVFDRGGFLYHGRIKALADAAREGGLEF